MRLVFLPDSSPNLTLARVEYCATKPNNTQSKFNNPNALEKDNSTEKNMANAI